MSKINTYCMGKIYLDLAENFKNQNDDQNNKMYI